MKSTAIELDGRRLAALQTEFCSPHACRARLSIGLGTARPQSPNAPPLLHSFPTRRSSDLRRRTMPPTMRRAELLSVRIVAFGEDFHGRVRLRRTQINSAPTAPTLDAMTNLEWVRRSLTLPALVAAPRPKGATRQ